MPTSRIMCNARKKQYHPEETRESTMHLQKSAEMYLETIVILTQTSDNVHSIDDAAHMGYSKPSVSRANGLLKKAEGAKKCLFCF